MTVAFPLPCFNIKRIKGRTIAVCKGMCVCVGGGAKGEAAHRACITVYLNVNETKQIAQESFIREKMCRRQTAVQF